MIKHKSRGHQVGRLQKILGQPQTDYCNRKTVDALRDLQGQMGLKADGVFGPRTWTALVKRLRKAGRLREFWPVQPVTPIELNLEALKVLNAKGLRSYKRVHVRADLAEALKGAFDEVHRAGGVITTSGSRRGLKDRVSSSRSATSFHYVGRAFDLGVYTATVNTETDPFLVAKDKELEAKRQFRIFVRVTDEDHPLAVRRTLTVMNRSARKEADRWVEVEALVIDFTALMGEVGFVPIGARERSWKDPFGRNRNSGLEWWHFQNTSGLDEGVTFFGEELLAIHMLKDLEDSKPWKHRGKTFGEGFA